MVFCDRVVYINEGMAHNIQLASYFDKDVVGNVEI